MLDHGEHTNLVKMLDDRKLNFILIPGMRLHELEYNVIFYDKSILI